MRLKTYVGRLALLTAALIWGSSFIIMKDTVDNVPVFMLLGIRFTIAFLLLGLIFLPRLLKAGRAQVLHGFLCSLMLLSAYAAQTFGLMDTTPGKNAFLTAVYCVLVPFGAWMLYRKRPSAYNWVAAVMCLTGIGLVSLSGDFRVGRGDVLTLLGGVIYALHVLALNHFCRTDDPVTLTVLQFGFTAALSWLMSLLTESGAPLPGQEAILPLMYLGVFATGAALLLQCVGQSLTPPSQAALLLSLESVFGVAFSVAGGKETLSAPLCAGFLLIFLSVIISETQLSFLRRHK